MLVKNLLEEPTELVYPRSTDELMYQLQLRACRFFWIKADASTGLVNDRAKNSGEDHFTIASMASTGYGLAALPIGVERNWLSKDLAYSRALKTLQFVNDAMPHTKGWLFHFVEKSTGERVWNCELSSIDTALFIVGALVCGQYYQGTDVQRLANALYDRLDWRWMLTNGGEQPNKLVLSHGWKPEHGFLASNWDTYCELMFLYLLGMGATQTPISPASWKAWYRPVIEYGGRTTLLGGPIFVHQMAHGYYNFQDQIDGDGWNYWYSSYQATHINKQFCSDNFLLRKTYTPNIWGINAGDYSGGYRAFSAPGEEDGTVSPTGAVASIIFTPELSQQAAWSMFDQYGERIWGQFGFANGFNVDQHWFDPDVIGIDLGMALLNIENAQTGLIWKLLASHSSTDRAWKFAGFKRVEKSDALKVNVSQPLK